MSDKLQLLESARLYPAVKTCMNARYFPKWGEVNDQASETVPDQSLSIRDIMVRYSRGLPINGKLDPQFQEDEEFYPDPKRMDLADREEMEIQAREELAEIAAKQASEKAAKAAAKAAKQKEQQQQQQQQQPNGQTETTPKSES